MSADQINLTSANRSVEAASVAPFGNITSECMENHGNGRNMSQDRLTQAITSYQGVAETIKSTPPLKTESVPASSLRQLPENEPQQNSFMKNRVEDLRTYRIKASVLTEIHKKIGKHWPELGGMLGGSRKDRTITHFHFDSTADTSGGTYTPDNVALNIILKQWNDEGIDLVGMVHSHPGNFIRPSMADEMYAAEFLRVCEGMDAFFMPIVRTEGNGGFEMRGYVVERHPSGRPRLFQSDYQSV